MIDQLVHHGGVEEPLAQTLLNLIRRSCKLPSSAKLKECSTYPQRLLDPTKSGLERLVVLRALALLKPRGDGSASHASLDLLLHTWSGLAGAHTSTIALGHDSTYQDLPASHLNLGLKIRRRVQEPMHCAWQRFPSPAVVHRELRLLNPGATFHIMDEHIVHVMGVDHRLIETMNQPNVLFVGVREGHILGESDS